MYLVYVGCIPLIYMVYIRFQDFVGSITVAPTPSHRIFRTTFFQTLVAWSVAWSRVPRAWSNLVASTVAGSGPEVCWAVGGLRCAGCRAPPSGYL
jgi:hypothetical protein